MFLVVLFLIIPMGASAGNLMDPVDDQEEAESAFLRVRGILSGFGITVDREILLLLRSRDEVQVHFVSTGGRAIEVGGFYRPFAPESIWVVSGRPRGLLMGDLAHELAHAWQSTNSPLQDRKIKEGFAMWCQYKTLVSLGREDMARQYARLKDPDYGGGLRMFLKIEEEKGLAGVIEFARTIKKVPDRFKDI